MTWDARGTTEMGRAGSLAAGPGEAAQSQRLRCRFAALPQGCHAPERWKEEIEGESIAEVTWRPFPPSPPRHFPRVDTVLFALSRRFERLSHVGPWTPCPRLPQKALQSNRRLPGGKLKQSRDFGALALPSFVRLRASAFGVRFAALSKVAETLCAVTLSLSGSVERRAVAADSG
eukprot:scaffold1954_cov268-Pinguiococcus_pyrenoidosus.AAC.20